MATEANSTIEQKEVASTLSTADNSIVENNSAHDEDANAPATSNEKEEPETPGSDLDDQTVYPPMMTKVAVGIGLAFAIFLVYPLS